MFDFFADFSIITIDFFHNVCYTQIKLDNKTNNLTSKITKQKQKKSKTKRSKKWRTKPTKKI